MTRAWSIFARMDFPIFVASTAFSAAVADEASAVLRLENMFLYDVRDQSLAAKKRINGKPVPENNDEGEKRKVLRLLYQIKDPPAM